MSRRGRRPIRQPARLSSLSLRASSSSRNYFLSRLPSLSSLLYIFSPSSRENCIKLLATLPRIHARFNEKRHCISKFLRNSWSCILNLPHTRTIYIYIYIVHLVLDVLNKNRINIHIPRFNSVASSSAAISAL